MRVVGWFVLFLAGSCLLGVAIGALVRWWRGPDPLALPNVTQYRGQSPASRRAELSRQTLDALIFPYELVPGAEAQAAFEAAQAKGQAEGFSPLIITPVSSIPTDMARQSWLAATRRILASAEVAREADMFRNEDAELVRVLDEVAAEQGADPPSPDHIRQMSFVRDVSSLSPWPLFAEVALARIPTPRSWEIPAHMVFDGPGGHFPTAAQIMAAARHWHERYGADICTIGRFALEFRVQRPPADRREAIRLLREHLSFSSLFLEHIASNPDMLREFLRDNLAWLPRQTYWQFGWEL